MPQYEQIAISINQYLQRFPLILDILEEIHEVPHVGDEELKHGSIRAVQTILERLRNIQSADKQKIRPIESTREPTLAEQIAGEWLLGERPKTFIPAPLVNELESLISSLLPGLRGHPREQAS
jgi:hypothetical protein